jgi:hypothetical protein
MSIRKWIIERNQLVSILSTVLKLASALSGLGALTGWIFKILEWGHSGPFPWMKENVGFLWGAAVTSILLLLFFWTWRLHRQFISRFKDNFKGNLRDKWDYQGPWLITEENTLLVTGSDAGGITKVGAQWENYTFEFEAKIVNTCLGVVVRAQDLNNYYMFQINREQNRIRPHRRAAVPCIPPQQASPQPEAQQPNQPPPMQPISIYIGWDKNFEPIPISPEALTGWFKVRLKVHGESVKFYVNDELTFEKDSILKIATGKVGFRNSGAESAFVRKVKVTIQP